MDRGVRFGDRHSGALRVVKCRHGSRELAAALYLDFDLDHGVCLRGRWGEKPVGRGPDNRWKGASVSAGGLITDPHRPSLPIKQRSRSRAIQVGAVSGDEIPHEAAVHVLPHDHQQISRSPKQPDVTRAIRRFDDTRGDAQVGRDTGAIVEVSADFFIRRVLPAFEAAASRISRAMPAEAAVNAAAT